MGNESNWGESDRPTVGGEHSGWDICRASHLKVIRFACVSVKHYGVYTHWLKGRAQPHLKLDCPGCAEQKDLRWYGFLLGLLYPTKNKILFEFTAGSSDTVNKCFEEKGSLRGLIFQASRPRGKPNSRVQLVCTDSRCDPEQLVPDQAVQPLLAKLWGCNLGDTTLHGGEDINLASEDLRVQAGLRDYKIRPAEVMLDGRGEVRAMKDVLAELPGQQHLFSENGKR